MAGFDNLGLSQLGSESKYMNRENAFSTGMQGLKDFGIMYGMDKAGIYDFLNNAFAKKEEIKKKYSALNQTKPTVSNASAPPLTAPTPVAPPQNIFLPQNATESFPVLPQSPIQQAPLAPPTAQNIFMPQNAVESFPVLQDSPIERSPLPFMQPENNGMSIEDAANRSMGISSISPDSLMLRDPAQDQVAMNMNSVPPPQMNLPQYGKQNNGQGTLMNIVKLFMGGA